MDNCHRLGSLASYHRLYSTLSRDHERGPAQKLLASQPKTRAVLYVAALRRSSISDSSEPLRSVRLPR